MTAVVQSALRASHRCNATVKIFEIATIDDLRDLALSPLMVVVYKKVEIPRIMNRYVDNCCHRWLRRKRHESPPPSRRSGGLHMSLKYKNA